MADVRINSVESQITIADGEALLTPEVVEMLVKIIRQRLQSDNQRQRESNDDRKLVEGASR